MLHIAGLARRGLGLQAINAPAVLAARFASVPGGDNVGETLKNTAKGVADKAFGKVDQAKEFVQQKAQDVKQFDATDRIKDSQEGYTQAIKNTADKAASGTKAAGEHVASMAQTGVARGVDAAQGASQDLHNTASGQRGPSAAHGAGGDDAIKHQEQAGGPAARPLQPGDKPKSRAEGTGSLGRNGTHLAIDSEGQMSSQT